MLTRMRIAFGLAAVLAAAGFFGSSTAQAQVAPPQPGQDQADLPAPPPDSDGDPNTETYNRGPLHEAFAQPIANDPAESPVVAKQPPDPVNEAPPDEKPEGNDVEWIPGYWAWDDDLGNFLWVSGLWRDMPPGRQWIPGYWQEVEGGYRWIHGMWQAEETQELAYLPQPPASLEQGPSSPQPDDNHFWIPGNWVYQNANYQWRPGYWSPFQENWVWIPAHYVLTPGGYVFVPGYWDYEFADRGMVFAPVAFASPPVAVYTPVVVVNTWQNFFVNLFVGPRRGAYFFGNYYGPTYVTAGIVPWYSFGSGRRVYDPLYVHYHHRYGDAFTNRLHGWHDYYMTHQNMRPPVTMRQQQRFLAEHRNDQYAAHAAMAMRLRDVHKAEHAAPFQFAKLSQEQRVMAHKNARQVAEFSQERRKYEHEHRDAIKLDRVGEKTAGQQHTFQLPKTNPRPRPAISTRPEGKPETNPGVVPPGKTGVENRLPKTPRLPEPGNRNPREGELGRERNKPLDQNPNQPPHQGRTDIHRLLPNTPGAKEHENKFTPRNNPRNQPGVGQPNLGQPNTGVPKQPGFQPNQPGFQPKQPGIQPNQPQPRQPGFQPNQPQPRQPGFQPNQPQPKQPGFQPNQPQPKQPGFQPGQPRPNPGNNQPEKNPRGPKNPGTAGLFPGGNSSGPTSSPQILSTRRFEPQENRRISGGGNNDVRPSIIPNQPMRNELGRQGFAGQPSVPRTAQQIDPRRGPGNISNRHVNQPTPANQQNPGNDRPERRHKKDGRD